MAKGKAVDFSNETGEYILWMVGPDGNKGATFNRAFGPFPSREIANSAKRSLNNQMRKRMREDYYSDSEIEDRVAKYSFTTTKLWRKV